MELSQIRYFMALCSERNFTRAAKRCGVSQPSLSNGIKVLEFGLGGRLFERSDMSLTSLGKSVHQHFEAALAGVEQITKSARNFRRRQLNRSRVAASRSLQLVASAIPPNGSTSSEKVPEGETRHNRNRSEGSPDQHIADRSLSQTDAEALLERFR